MSGKIINGAFTPVTLETKHSASAKMNVLNLNLTGVRRKKSTLTIVYDRGCVCMLLNV